MLFRDRPRKAGGGYGNVGNAKDMQHPEKYGEDKVGEEKPAEEQTTEVVEEKEPEVEKLTLEEYYKAKGVEIAYQNEEKGPAKKEVKAEWIKKEKLTVMTTKEDLKNQEKKSQQTVKQNTAKTGLGIDEGDFDKVGFGAKQPSKEAPKQEENRGGKRGGKKAQPKFSNDDFPSL